MQVPLANSTSPPLKHVFGPENPEKKRKYRNFRAIDFFESAFLLFNYLNGFIGLTIIIYSCAWSQSPSKILPPLPAFCPHSFTEPQSLYRKNFSFDLHALLRKNETDFVQESELLWTKRGLTYGDLQSVHRFTTNVSIPESTRTNGSLYLHIYLTRSGFPPGPRKGLYMNELYTIHKKKRVTFTVKLDKNCPQTDHLRSCWASNWTVNLVDGSALRSRLQGAERRLVDCDSLTKQFYPILYLNDKFNLARDCIPIDIPINKTTQSLPLTLNFRQIGVNKLRKYLKHKDFGDYLGAQNLTQEDDLREKLIESDFKWKPYTRDVGTGMNHKSLSVVLWGIFLAAMIIFKFALFVLGK